MDRNSLTLLAVLTLAVSNLLVGISTQNTYLILASSAISATLAGVYIVRSRMSRGETPEKAPQRPISHARAVTRRRVFPLWVFGAVLFIILPALLLFMQTSLQLS